MKRKWNKKRISNRNLSFLLKGKREKEDPLWLGQLSSGRRKRKKQKLKNHKSKLKEENIFSQIDVYFLF